MNALNDSMERRIASKVQHAITNNKKLETLKDELLAAKSIPSGIVQEAEVRHDILPSTITNHLKNKYKQKNVTLWIDLVGKKFDTISTSIKNGDTSFLFDSDKGTISRQNYSPSDATSSSASSSSGVVSSNVSQQKKKRLKDDEIIRSCTVSMESILRQEGDHDKELKAHFLLKINEAIAQVSRYSPRFGLLVLSLITVLKHHSFVVNQGGTLEIQYYQGLQISRIFPDTFNVENDMLAPPPIDSNTILGHDNKQFQKDFESLFTQTHLQNVHSHFFGEKGLSNNTKNNHPLITSFLNFIPKNGNFPFNSDAAAAVTKSALEKYITNFSNMWKNGRIFKKSLDNLLAVLFKIHLAPKNYKARQEYISQLKSKNKHNEKQRKQRDRHRNIIRNKKHNMKKCEQKAEKCTDPKRKERYLGLAKYYKLTIQDYITKFKESKKTKGEFTPNNDDTGMQSYKEVRDGEKVPKSGDISSRRIESLVAITRKLLYQRKQRYTEYNFREQMSSITNDEAKVCVKLANYIGPYIPEKKKMSTIMYLLPLVLLANDVFKITGFSSKVTQICPLPSLCHLDALSLNTEIIFDLFCSKQATQPMEIYGSNENYIQSQDASLSQKYYMFDAFFNMDIVSNTCGQHHLEFVYQMHILPGAKTARLIGIKNSPDAIKRTTMIENKTSPTYPLVIAEESKSRTRLENEKKLLETEILALEGLLKDAYKERDQQGTVGHIKEEKAKWVSPNTGLNRTINDDIMKKIKVLKDKRQKELVTIQTLKEKLSVARTKNWIIQRTLNNKTMGVKTKADPKVQKKVITRSNPALLEKTENITLSVNPNHCTYSGTDNGLKAMTTTVPVSHSLYTYHKNLHDGNPADSINEFRPLPRPLVIRSNDIDVGTGEAYMRRWRLNRKKNTDKGIDAQGAEKKLAEIASVKVETYTDVFDMFNKQHEQAKVVKEFYGEKAFIKKQRTKEISAEKFKDKIASKERRFVGDADRKGKLLPIMMIGDRGTGVRSTIKGFNRYGGKWLPKRHGRYLAACITNEHNSSQVCVYCFNKIIHPKRVIKTAEGKTKSIDSNGSSQCINTKCVSFKAGRAVQSRDVQSALAICLAGVSPLINGRPFKELDPKNSHSNTVKSNKPSSSGTEARVGQPA